MNIFFDLLVVTLSYSFKGCFKNTYPPINLEYWPLEVVRPPFLAYEPSLTYTLIRLWCRSTLKTLLIAFFELLFLESCVMLGGLWWTLSPLPSCFMFIIFFLLPAWVECGGGHHYWVIFKHEALSGFLFVLAHYQILLETITWAPNCVFPSLTDDIHSMSEITCAFGHLSIQLALVGLRVKVSKCKLWSLKSF